MHTNQCNVVLSREIITEEMYVFEWMSICIYNSTGHLCLHGIKPLTPKDYSKQAVASWESPMLTTAIRLYNIQCNEWAI